MINLSVKDIMKRPVATASPQMPLSDAVHQMLTGPYGSLPVVNEEDKVVGILTESDIFMHADIYSGNGLRCSSVMTGNPITVETTMSLVEAAKTMMTNHIRSLPVMEDGKLVGIVARRDILSALSGERNAEDTAFAIDTIRSFLSAKSPEAVLHMLVHRLGAYFEATRCSVIRVNEERACATVISTLEKTPASSFELDLQRYPEIMKAMTTGEPVVLNDAIGDPLMQPVRRFLKDPDFRSILVIPMSHQDKVLGTLHLRTHTRRQFTEKEIKVIKMLSSLATDAIRAVIKKKELKKLYREAERKTIIDPLTGLFNRGYFFKRLDEEFGLARRHCLPLCCIMFDIDDFKNVNDKFGHQTGDLVLKGFGARLKEEVRVSDIAARYGGEEFALLLPMTGGDGAVSEAEKLKGCLDRLEFDIPSLTLTSSIGVSMFPFPGIKKAEDLLKNADTAMYWAKQNGKNRIVVYSTALTPLILSPEL